MEISNIKFNNGRQYKVTTADEIVALVEQATDYSIYKIAVAANAIKFGFGFNEDADVNFVVAIKLSKDSDLSNEMQEASLEDVAVSLIQDITLELTHQVIHQDVNVQDVLDDFTNAVNAVNALKRALADADLVITRLS